MHKRLSLLTRLCLLIYLFTPNVHLSCTTMKIGVCKWRRGLAEGRGCRGSGGGASAVAQDTDYPSCQGSVFPVGTSQRPVCCSCGPDGIFVWRTWDASPPLLPTVPADFPPQPGPKCRLALVLPAPIHHHPSHATAVLSRQMHRASHARLSFPHSLIATLPVFPEFYIAFTVCFYDV